MDLLILVGANPGSNGDDIADIVTDAIFQHQPTRTIRRASHPAAKRALFPGRETVAGVLVLEVLPFPATS